MSGANSALKVAGGAAAGAGTMAFVDMPEWARPFFDRLSVELGIAGVAMAVMLGVTGLWLYWRTKRYDELANENADAAVATAVALEKGVNATATHALAVRDMQSALQTFSAALTNTSRQIDDAHHEQREAMASAARTLDGVVHQLGGIDRQLGHMDRRLEDLERGRAPDARG